MRTRYSYEILAAAICLLLAYGTASAVIVTEIIDSTGDGAGNTIIIAQDVITDSLRNAYVSGFFLDHVFEVQPDGTTTVILDGPTSGGLLDGPARFAIDGVDNLYVSGWDGDDAWKIEPGGAATQIIDASGDGAGNTLNTGADVAVDSSGNVYVVGGTSSNIFKIEPGGAVTEIIDFNGDGTGNIFFGPRGVAVDDAGNVYVTASNSNNAFKIEPGGTITEIIDETGDGLGNVLDLAWGIAVDGDGNVYVTGSGSANAFKIEPGGTITQIMDISGDGVGNALEGPRAIALDSLGNVYISGSVSNNAFRLTPGGAVRLLIDGTGDGAGNLLDSPESIHVDAFGTVFVAGRQTANAFELATECGDSIFNPLGGEECEDGNAVDGDGCSSACEVDPCYSCSGDPSLCVAEIPAGCTDPGKGVVILKDNPSDVRRDRLVWRWRKGDTTIDQFGEPTVDTTYELCVFDDSEVVVSTAVAPAGTCGNKACWSTITGKGFKYLNKTANEYGVSRVSLKESKGKGKLLFKGAGAGLLLPGPVGAERYFNQTSEVNAVLQTSDGAQCWQAVFTESTKNNASLFKAVFP